MWCEASLTGFSHMMLYQQAANERKCPGKIQGKCFNYFGTFSKMVDNFVGKGYNEKKAIKQTLMYYSEKYGIEWRLL